MALHYAIAQLPVSIETRSGRRDWRGRGLERGMIDVVSLVLGFVASLLKSQARPEVEVLRHQLAVLRRRAPRRPHLSAVDRLIPRARRRGLDRVMSGL
jgi:hypothetical protein